jgi:hypothetical protein
MVRVDTAISSAIDRINQHKRNGTKMRSSTFDALRLFEQGFTDGSAELDPETQSLLVTLDRELSNLL